MEKQGRIQEESHWGLGEARGGGSGGQTVDPQTKAACLDGGREGRRGEEPGGQAPSPAYLGQKDWPAPPQTPPLPQLPTPVAALWGPSSPLRPQNRSPHLGLFMGGKSTDHNTLGSCPGCAEMLRVASSWSRTQESSRIVPPTGVAKKTSQTGHVPQVMSPTNGPLAHSALATLPGCAARCSYPRKDVSPLHFFPAPSLASLRSLPT